MALKYDVGSVNDQLHVYYMFTMKRVKRNKQVIVRSCEGQMSPIKRIIKISTMDNPLAVFLGFLSSS